MSDLGKLPYRRADFDSLAEALDYAALSEGTLSFYNVRGKCEHQLTYHDVREQAQHLARRLTGLGLERGHHVGIVADMHPDFITAFYACQYGGFVAVPLPVVSGLGGRRGYELQLVRIFENSNIQAIITSAQQRETFLAVSEKLPPGRLLTMEELLKCEPAAQDLTPLGPDEISHIQFSSGSTRFPLGVEISQRALMANSKSIAADGLDMQAADRLASWLPFYHDMGLIGQCIVPVTCQVSVDYLYTTDFARRPLQWLSLISQCGSTISFSPDFGFEICTRLGKRGVPDDLDLSHWRIAGIGGDMVRPHILQQFSEIFAESGFKKEAFLPSYGLAEATLAFSFEKRQTGMVVDEVDKEILAKENRAQAVSAGQPSDIPTRLFTSCGTPLPGYGVEIRGANSSVLTEREVGEVWVSGPSLMTSYYNQPEATSQCLSDDGWLNTGDMGYLVGEQLYITGRYKDLIIVKGRNIWPQDLEWHIEREISDLPGRSSAAFAHQTPEGDEVTVILVQCRKKDLESRENLRREVSSVISRNVGIVCQIELIPPRSLPFTTSGKLIRSRAKQNWIEGIYNEPDSGISPES